MLENDSDICYPQSKGNGTVKTEDFRTFLFFFFFLISRTWSRKDKLLIVNQQLPDICSPLSSYVFNRCLECCKSKHLLGDHCLSGDIGRYALKIILPFCTYSKYKMAKWFLMRRDFYMSLVMAHVKGQLFINRESRHADTKITYSKYWDYYCSHRCQPSEIESDKNLEFSCSFFPFPIFLWEVCVFTN